MPAWYLPSFDLSTEFHYFLEELRDRFHKLEMNTWIIKPAIGTRAVGHYILKDHRDSTTRKSLEEMAIEAALVAPKLKYSSIWHEIIREQTKQLQMPFENALQTPNNDRIAQQLVIHPLLVQGLKFDLRIYVFVRSFVPFEG
jgi:hypothetical protein